MDSHINANGGDADVFLSQATYLDDILKLRSKHHCIVRVLPPESEEKSIPDFCHVLSSSVLCLHDSMANYHKSVRLERLFGPKSENHDLAQHLDYLAYAVAKGENAVVASIGTTAPSPHTTLFGKNFDGVAHMIMAHAFQISDSLPGERSLSIRMLEVHGNDYFDLLTDYKKTPLTQDTLLEKLTEIPVNSIDLVSEWVDQGFTLMRDSTSDVCCEKYMRNSTVVLYFIIETVVDNKVITSTIMFVDFRDLDGILAQPQDPLCKAMLGEIDESHPLISHVFHTDSNKCFLFNLKPDLASAPSTLQTLYVAGEFGGITQWDMAVHTAPESLKAEIAEYRQRLPGLLKDFTGMYPVLRRETDLMVTAQRCETLSERIDRVNAQHAEIEFQRKAELVVNREEWEKTAHNSEVQVKLAASKYDFKTGKTLSVKEYLDHFTVMKNEKTVLPDQIQNIIEEYSRKAKALKTILNQNHVTDYEIPALPEMPSTGKASLTTTTKKARAPVHKKGKKTAGSKRSSPKKKKSTK